MEKTQAPLIETTPIPIPKIELTKKEPSELALTLSDLPDEYTIVERTERTKSDVSKEGLELGWKKGYYVRFAKVDKDNPYMVTVIEQLISIYPAENISKVIVLPTESSENRTYEELSNPGIGDKSRAFRITVKDEFGEEKRVYMIEFIKKDVYEALYMHGTVTDYELLKEIARKAAEKI